MSENPHHPPAAVGPATEVIRAAATVMLVRDADPGIETFVLRRVPAMAFAAGMTVFPGGGVDPADGTDIGWYGPDAGWWGAALGEEPAMARGLVVAAVRELFEETGVLLAGPGPDGPVPVLPADIREAVVERRASLWQVLADAGLGIRSDLLRPWANWLTPPGQGRRYDTFFFAAALPAGQQARMLTTEADLGEWRRPDELFAERAAGRTKLMPPTMVMLRDLAGFGSVRQLLAEPRVVTKVRVRPEDVARLVAGDGMVVPQ
ncbi:NUDIX hydrolase [Nakamurella sp.]|uniref:NUDIX hydrolase n=1 Tax=Nakamurella sp. TaxID=1869182 RepID=UPI0037841943